MLTLVKSYNLEHTRAVVFYLCYGNGSDFESIRVVTMAATCNVSDVLKVTVPTQYILPVDK